MSKRLETLMKQAESDAGYHADLLAMEGAWLVSGESEPFFLGQEIWWKPDPTTPEKGPGTILFRKIDYPLLHKKAVIRDYPIEETGIVRRYGQVVSSVLVEFQGTERMVLPSTITRRGPVSPDRVSQQRDHDTVGFVACECRWPIIGPDFHESEDPWMQPIESCICHCCGGII